MRPSNNPNGNFKAKDGEQNGSRIYQLMLNSMQILPVADISHIAFDDRIIDTAPSSSKGKRKADAPVNPPPNKKEVLRWCNGSQINAPVIETTPPANLFTDICSEDDVYADTGNNVY